MVVGLGNPGPEYAGHRHNAGAMVLDALAAEHGLRFAAHKARAQLVRFRLAPVGGVLGPALILAKPCGYMNTSGGPVASLVRFFKVDADRLLVIHDELDLPLGQLRLKLDGGEGGHNGLRSVSSALGTKAYCRLRLGIGRPPGRMDPADYVLRRFGSSEREDAQVMINQAADVVVDVARSGWERAQADVNARG